MYTNYYVYILFNYDHKSIIEMLIFARTAEFDHLHKYNIPDEIPMTYECIRHVSVLNSSDYSAFPDNCFTSSGRNYFAYQL